MNRPACPWCRATTAEDQDPALLQREADRIGYPVLIKASAGGGGKGMRAVEKAEDFAAALASCKREAINSFGSDAVLVEKYVQRPRHIEIQVFGDTTATASTCSSAIARAAAPPGRCWKRRPRRA